MPRIEPAQLEWDVQGRPRSRRFGDIYFSADQGLEETRHVFLRGNDLPGRWVGRRRFTIGETGFGTGLNFLVTWALWDQTAAPDARLDFVSVEGFPLTLADFRRCSGLLPGELAGYGQRLTEAYGRICTGVGGPREETSRVPWLPPEVACPAVSSSAPLQILCPGPGFHRLHLGRVRLTLLVGPVETVLRDLQARVDAWFLDGFAPSRNPRMWSDEVFEQLAHLSAPGATLATYTAAGAVRRGLTAAGFEVEKVPGHGQKRDMVRGRLAVPHSQRQGEPWYCLPAPEAVRNRSALVLGAGLAGAGAAFALARRGWRVTVIDRAAVAGGASGNRIGLFQPLLTLGDDPASRYITAAFRFTRAYVQEMRNDKGAAFSGSPARAPFQACGVLHLPRDQASAQRLRAIADAHAGPGGMATWLDCQRVSEQCGLDLPTGGMWVPDAGWVHPAALCQAQLTHPHIRVIEQQAVARLEREDHQWLARDAQGELIAAAEVAIVATAQDALHLPQLDWLPLRAVRGQVSDVPAGEASQTLRAVVCYDGYITPAISGRHAVGATFDRDSTDLDERQIDHEHNLAALGKAVPVLADALGPAAKWQGRAALRSTTPDRLPAVGPVPAHPAFERDYADLRHGRPAMTYPPATHLRGLYVSAGHGSRGIVSSCLAGELLASEIEGEPLPLERDLVDALNPARFLVRALRRRTPRCPRISPAFHAP